jgi:hypothetical protein
MTFRRLPGKGDCRVSEYDDLGKLGELLTTPSFRAAFARDPWRATREAGLDPDSIDSTVFDALSELTAAELRVLAEVGQALRDAGVEASTSLRMV